MVYSLFTVSGGVAFQAGDVSEKRPGKSANTDYKFHELQSDSVY
jgi:hypothetical protein